MAGNKGWNWKQLICVPTNLGSFCGTRGSSGWDRIEGTEVRDKKCLQMCGKGADLLKEKKTGMRCQQTGGNGTAQRKEKRSQWDTDREFTGR